MKNVHVDDVNEDSFNYKSSPKTEQTIIEEGIQLLFNILEEAMLKTEEYVADGKIYGGPVQINYKR